MKINNKFRYTIYTIFMTVLTSALFTACQGSDNDNGSGLASPAADLTGEWEIEEKAIETDCDWGSGYVNNYTTGITQSGNSLSFEIASESINGTIAGNSVKWSGTITQGSGSIDISFTGMVSADGNTISGTAPWTWTSNDDETDTCTGTSEITGRRRLQSEYEPNDNVIMIGDSVFALNEYIADELERLSQSTYRHYYASGTGFIVDVSPSIGQQYLEARVENSDIRTVIMNGGGNDIKNNTYCYGSVSGTCGDTVGEIVDSAEALINEMLNDGVDNVVYLYYPHLTGMAAVLNPVLDYALDLIEARLAMDNVYFINPVEDFEGHSDYMLDGIHPSEAGGKALAGLIWDVMEDNDLER